MDKVQEAYRVYVSKSTHDKILAEKKRQGGRNIPFVIADLVDCGLEHKRLCVLKK